MRGSLADQPAGSLINIADASTRGWLVLAVCLLIALCAWCIRAQLR
jgi:hypothetical protein